MKINGMEAKHIGLVGWVAPWLGNEYDIFDNIWGTPDGKRYIERYFLCDIVEYNWQKHGYIWYDWVIDKHYQDYIKEHKDMFDELEKVYAEEEYCIDEFPDLVDDEDMF